MSILRAAILDAADLAVMDALLARLVGLRSRAATSAHRLAGAAQRATHQRFAKKPLVKECPG